jgi:hypothetical protein
MKLPIQTMPVERTQPVAAFTPHLVASATDPAACKAACARLPEPARSMCKAQCDWPN